MLLLDWVLSTRRRSEDEVPWLAAAFSVLAVVERFDATGAPGDREPAPRRASDELSLGPRYALSAPRSRREAELDAETGAALFVEPAVVPRSIEDRAENPDRSIRCWEDGGACRPVADERVSRAARPVLETS